MRRRPRMRANKTKTTPSTATEKATNPVSPSKEGDKPQKEAAKPVKTAFVKPKEINQKSCSK